jgi:antitoxin (DNA-binding transcriptional repressor) of toxin-antitoxin stability system
MQRKVLGAFEARRGFGTIIEDVGYKGETVTVEKNGKPLVAIVPLQVLEYWECERQRFYNDLRQMHMRSTLSEEAAMELVNQEIQAYRTNKKLERIKS